MIPTKQSGYQRTHSAWSGSTSPRRPALRYVRNTSLLRRAVVLARLRSALSIADCQSWVHRVYALSSTPSSSDPVTEPPSTTPDVSTVRLGMRPRIRRLISDGLQAMLLVGLILAGLAIFAGLVIGAMWTNETVLSFILCLMNLFVAMVMYDGVSL